MPVRVVLVDDHQIVREALNCMLSNDSSIEVVAEASDGKECLSTCRQLLPDVILMDISLPKMDGITATKQITQEMPQTKVIALSVHSSQRYVAQMLRAGASGYLQKNCSLHDMIQGIKSVMAGNTYLCPHVVEALTGEYVRLSRMSKDKRPSELTERERQVVQVLAEGNNTKQAAKVLKISPKTLETHRRNIMRKLKMNNIAELTKYALKEELISLEVY